MSIRSLSGNAGVLKKINRARLLNHLWHSKGSSRTHLAETTGLDRKTITNICNSLLKDRLINVEDVSSAGMGRPPQRISLNSDALYSIGVDVGGGHVSAVLMDFTGSIRDSSTVSFSGKWEGSVWNRVEEAIISLLHAFPGDISVINGIGICVPGLLDYEKGEVIRSVNIGELENCHVTGLLEDRFELPVFMEESSRSMAMAEIWFGGRYGLSDFIVVDLGVGIGLGIVHDGTLYKGGHGNSGEIGHLVVQPGGIHCRCGKTGCLETVASGRAFDEISNRLKLDGGQYFSSGGQALRNAAEGGNLDARRILEEAGTFIGMALANVVNILDPSEIILQGGLIKVGDFLLEPLKRSLVRHTLGGVKKPSLIEISRLGDNAGAIGAGILPMKKYFEMENIRFY